VMGRAELYEKVAIMEKINDPNLATTYNNADKCEETPIASSCLLLIVNHQEKADNQPEILQ